MKADADVVRFAAAVFDQADRQLDGLRGKVIQRWCVALHPHGPDGREEVELRVWRPDQVFPVSVTWTFSFVKSAVNPDRLMRRQLAQVKARLLGIETDAGTISRVAE